MPYAAKCAAWLVLWALLGLVLVSCAAAGPGSGSQYLDSVQFQMEGILHVVDMDYPHGDFHTTQYLLRDQRTRALFQLEFPESQEPAAGMGSGHLIRVVALLPNDTPVDGRSSNTGSWSVLGSRVMLSSKTSGKQGGHSSERILRKLRPLAQQGGQQLRQRMLTAGSTPAAGSHGDTSGALQGAVKTGPPRDALAAAGNMVLSVVSWQTLPTPTPSKPTPPALRKPGSKAGSLSPPVTGQGGGMPTVSVRDAGSAAVYTPRYNTDRLLMDDVSTVVFITNMCGKGIAATREDIEDVLFNNANASLSDYMSSCSRGVAQLSRDNTLILGPIDIPCSGEYTGTAVPIRWSANTCTPYDYFGWQYYLEDWAFANGLQDILPRYRHRIVLTSPEQSTWMFNATGQPCAWTGLALVGPESQSSTYSGPGVFSFAWVNGDYWYQPHAWFHEIAHNYYLRHAATPACSYCDATCAMGFCCAQRCLNAPHAWQVGWSSLLLRPLDSTSLPEGVSKYVDLPVQGSMSRTSLRIQPTWAPDQAALWISYRRAVQPYDDLRYVDPVTGHVSPFDNVAIYSYSGASFIDAQLTMWRVTLASNGSWQDVLQPEDGRIVVQWLTPMQAAAVDSNPIQAAGRLTAIPVDWSAAAAAAAAAAASANQKSPLQFARVRLCRRASRRERDCTDGLDDDCDGLIDSADPDCAEGRFIPAEYEESAPPTAEDEDATPLSSPPPPSPPPGLPPKLSSPPPRPPPSPLPPLPRRSPGRPPPSPPPPPSLPTLRIPPPRSSSRNDVSRSPTPSRSPLPARRPPPKFALPSRAATRPNPQRLPTRRASPPPPRQLSARPPTRTRPPPPTPPPADPPRSSPPTPILISSNPPGLPSPGLPLPPPLAPVRDVPSSVLPPAGPSPPALEASPRPPVPLVSDLPPTTSRPPSTPAPPTSGSLPLQDVAQGIPPVDSPSGGVPPSSDLDTIGPSPQAIAPSSPGVPRSPQQRRSPRAPPSTPPAPDSSSEPTPPPAAPALVTEAAPLPPPPAAELTNMTGTIPAAVSDTPSQPPLAPPSPPEPVAHTTVPTMPLLLLLPPPPPPSPRAPHSPRRPPTVPGPDNPPDNPPEVPLPHPSDAPGAPSLPDLDRPPVYYREVSNEDVSAASSPPPRRPPQPAKQATVSAPSSPLPPSPPPPSPQEPIKATEQLTRHPEAVSLMRAPPQLAAAVIFDAGAGGNTNNSDDSGSSAPNVPDPVRESGVPAAGKVPALLPDSLPQQPVGDQDATMQPDSSTPPGHPIRSQQPEVPPEVFEVLESGSTLMPEATSAASTEAPQQLLGPEAPLTNTVEANKQGSPSLIPLPQSPPSPHPQLPSGSPPNPRPSPPLSWQYVAAVSPLPLPTPSRTMPSPQLLVPSPSPIPVAAQTTPVSLTVEPTISPTTNESPPSIHLGRIPPKQPSSPPLPNPSLPQPLPSPLSSLPLLESLSQPPAPQPSSSKAPLPSATALSPPQPTVPEAPLLASSQAAAYIMAPSGSAGQQQRGAAGDSMSAANATRPAGLIPTLSQPEQEQPSLMASATPAPAMLPMQGEQEEPAVVFIPRERPNRLDGDQWNSSARATDAPTPNMQLPAQPEEHTSHSAVTSHVVVVPLPDEVHMPASPSPPLKHAPGVYGSSTTAVSGGSRVVSDDS